MDKEYWHEKWQIADIGFHEADGNSLLPDYFQELSLPVGSRVFVPLCGKSRDIAWLLSQGYRIAGVELSEVAVQQLFAEMELEPTVVTKGGLKCYSVTDLDIFVGDFFQLTHALLGAVDATFDRAALVALPGEMRIRYAVHLTDITCQAPQLLITFEYDQTQMAGPPFSISDAEIPEHYRDCYSVAPLASVHVAGKLKGKCTAKENVWLLKPQV
ncbi:thiopurine S-methyltransferase [Anderseniella sp. Alg231-50]|uniref:thiopurine S-methyltransferase n=1 Tax=Anderseniella sp. Alg231-50 TaxID=1922226 RepID=UPI000D5615FC